MDITYMKKPKENLVGRKFGRLTVIEGGTTTEKGKYWKCLCECGNIRFYTRQNILKGTLKSCGCFKQECRGKQHKNWNGVGEIGASVVCRIRATANRRNIPFSVDAKYLWEVFLKQNKKCVLSGLPLDFPVSSWDVKHGKGTASLDRINSSLGYVHDNVQWVHKDINMMKQQFSQNHFIDMCRLVSQKYV